MDCKYLCLTLSLLWFSSFPTVDRRALDVLREDLEHFNAEPLVAEVTVVCRFIFLHNYLCLQIVISSIQVRMISGGHISHKNESNSKGTMKTISIKNLIF